MATTKLDIAQGKVRKNSAVATKHSAAGAEGVIGHGIGGKHIPAKMAQLAESQLLE